jgi:hypothetical protein
VPSGTGGLPIRNADAQHRDVVRRARTDKLRAVIPAIVQPHLGFGGALHHVVVGDDVAVVVPDETRACAAGNAEQIARPEVAHELRGRDENHRAFRAFEELDGGLLVGRQIAGRRDGARPTSTQRGPLL